MRTAASLVIQFFLMARHEEARRLQKSNILFLENGDLQFLFVYAKNNTDHENKISIMKSNPELGELNPVCIVKRYIKNINKIYSDHPLLFPKFKSIFSQGSRVTVISSELEPWSRDSCAKAYKEVYEKLGLDIDISSISGTHATRIGSATQAVKDGKVNMLDVKHAGRWVSDKTPSQYIRQDDISLSKVSKTLGNMMLNEQRKQIGIRVDCAIAEALDGFM